MAAIDTVAAQKGINDIGREALSAAFWIWYYNNQTAVFTVPVKFWIINTNVNITVLQMRPLFVMLFGEDPSH